MTSSTRNYRWLAASCTAQSPLQNEHYHNAKTNSVLILPFTGFRRHFPLFSSSLRLCHLWWEVPVGSYIIKAMEQINNIQVVPCTSSNYLRPFRVHYNQVSRYSLIARYLLSVMRSHLIIFLSAAQPPFILSLLLSTNIPSNVSQWQ